MDEETPHMHLVFIPVVHTKDKKGNAIDKIACSEFWKAKDKAIQELQEQNTLLTLALNRQLKTVDKAIKYEREIKPILDENAELKEKCETLEIIYNAKPQQEKEKIKDKYEDRIYNLEKENNFLRKVINTLQQTVEKFIHWICRKFSVSDEDELIRDF